MGDRPVLGKEEGTVLRTEADALALGRFIYQVRLTFSGQETAHVHPWRS